MPQKGKHRRPKSHALTRGFVAAGTGGAALALPLIGATGAHAAPAAPSAVTAQAVPAATPATQAAAPAAAEERATYRVVAGDHLSKIAADREIRGGWERLYADNREAVGGDPSLIHPGLELTLTSGDSRAQGGTDRKSTPAAAPAPASGGNGPAATSVREAAPAAPEAPAAPVAPEAPAARVATETPAAEPAPATGAWTTPLASGGVTTAYRATGSMWSSGYHTGVDFSAPSGTPVRSVGPGTVVSAGVNGAYGNEVVVQHADGHYSQYAHLSALSVSAGETVTGGQQIGLVGSTGNSSGPHLHLEIRTGTGYGSDVDPVAYLRGHGVAL
ncbi:LysM peptidoglycan-binding domain-containing M23 family metallopeptidase [Streptomyces sp. NPDC000594]|uniref:LysM peptidoglycan-binding domain-containing M23 family metallopeptidase n=1 Tax=Streptomyces sp. NPDC000594 TaxID=3154261 RepID=UPI0033259E12